MSEAERSFAEAQERVFTWWVATSSAQLPDVVEQPHENYDRIQLRRSDVHTLLEGVATLQEQLRLTRETAERMMRQLELVRQQAYPLGNTE